MEIRFEISKIESYSKALSEKLSNEFFSTYEVIRGEQIVKFTPIDQVNLFIVKNLFDKWKEESGKLKSPYFNYESPEVKEALQNVLNKLSQNISIRKEFFKPLLEKAIVDSLYLLLKPDGFYSNEFSGKSEISLTDLKDSEKFYKVNKSIFEQLISQLNRDHKSSFKGSELRVYIDILIKENPLGESEKERYLDQFSSLLKIERNAVESTPVSSVNLVQPVIKEDKAPVGNTNILNEKFGIAQPTVNDLLKQKQVTLAEKISKSKIENIKNAISLSQKFLFINALFKGVSSEYEKALTEIDQCQNFDQALSMLNTNYALKYQWDFNQYEVKEFVEIVERKFS